MSSFFPDCPYNLVLPDLKTLVVSGPFHASAPIHFAYSSHSENIDARIVIIASSQSALQKSLKEFNDEWLASHSATGQFMNWASNVKIFYPPSPAHLCLLLSMFHTLKENEVPEEEWLVKNLQSLEPPSLIILCELSAYFTSSAAEGIDHLASPTLPAYMNLISRAMSISSNIGVPGSRPKLALFDSRLSTLKLPVTHKPSVNFRHPPEEAQQQPTQQVFPLITHLFEYVALFDQDPVDTSYIPSSQGEEDEVTARPHKRLKVYESFQNADECPEFVWSEDTKNTFTSRQSYFVWRI